MRLTARTPNLFFVGVYVWTLLQLDPLRCLRYRDGQMGVAYAADDDRLIVIAEEMVVDKLEVEPASARFVLRREQVIGLIDRARDVVSAGRTPCPFCGTPLQPRNGGWCACSN